MLTVLSPAGIGVATTLGLWAVFIGLKYLARRIRRFRRHHPAAYVDGLLFTLAVVIIWLAGIHDQKQQWLMAEWLMDSPASASNLAYELNLYPPAVNRQLAEWEHQQWLEAYADPDYPWDERFDVTDEGLLHLSRLSWQYKLKRALGVGVFTADVIYVLVARQDFLGQLVSMAVNALNSN